MGEPDTRSSATDTLPVASPCVMRATRTITDAQILAHARRCFVDRGPAVSLAVIGKAVGLTPAGLIKRFGSKERLLFAAMLPPQPPGWLGTLSCAPPADVAAALVRVLGQLAREFEAVGPALAVLRMSEVSVGEVFAKGQPGPSLVARRLLARWLAQAGVKGDPAALADAAIGAAEARGFLTWIGPQMVADTSEHDWATALARVVLDGARA